MAQSHAEARLEEAVGLAAAINLQVAHAEVIRLDKPRPATLVGMGVIERLRTKVQEEHAVVVVVDSALTPVQQRNLESELECKVIDRTGLILEIFGARARTKEGRLQVQLAALNYQRSRLVRSWTHLERQRGGAGFMGGPGERQIELDRRMLDEQIIRLKKALKQVRRTRSLHRSARQRVPYPVIALVGYTNAGKSTLFNRMASAEVKAEDQLFATLDPTMRGIRLPSGLEAILSDTVGFITDLPTDLVAAFRATLEEVVAADVILHVRDVSHPETELHKQSVLQVLHDLGVAGEDSPDAKPIIEVFNKIDLLDQEALENWRALAERGAGRVMVSAVNGEGIDFLQEIIEQRLREQDELLSLAIDLKDGATLAWCYEHGRVISRHDDESKAHIRVSLDPANAARLKAFEA
ncbi:GTPase HflX [Fodinicurvata fenggangensis]|uniref:GTPase HflX n=1 Tax=Fodinicurvata fenggangensis TaxID=1121830 RepID=UPI0009DECF2F|nr:GTPase HflX [Fodinicurvata fenggangensis]